MVKKKKTLADKRTKRLATLADKRLARGAKQLVDLHQKVQQFILTWLTNIAKPSDLVLNKPLIKGTQQRYHHG